MIEHTRATTLLGVNVSFVHIYRPPLATHTHSLGPIKEAVKSLRFTSGLYVSGQTPEM